MTLDKLTYGGSSMWRVAHFLQGQREVGNVRTQLAFSCFSFSLVSDLIFTAGCHSYLGYLLSLSQSPFHKFPQKHGQREASLRSLAIFYLINIFFNNFSHVFIVQSLFSQSCPLFYCKHTSITLYSQRSLSDSHAFLLLVMYQFQPEPSVWPQLWQYLLEPDRLSIRYLPGDSYYSSLSIHLQPIVQQ